MSRAATLSASGGIDHVSQRKPAASQCAPPPSDTRLRRGFARKYRVGFKDEACANTGLAKISERLN
jgi:hypothetical protein